MSTPSTKEINIKDGAEFVLSWFQSSGKVITHLKLQKLLYYIQAWHLVYFEKHPLFNNEPQAWVNGPVYPSVYEEYKKYKNHPIELDMPNGTDDLQFLQESRQKLNLGKEQEELIDSVLHKYGEIPPLSLVYRTHREAPWLETRKGLSPYENCDRTISHDLMYQYYNSLIEKAKA